MYIMVHAWIIRCPHPNSLSVPVSSVQSWMDSSKVGKGGMAKKTCGGVCAGTQDTQGTQET